MNNTLLYNIEVKIIDKKRRPAMNSQVKNLKGIHSDQTPKNG